MKNLLRNKRKELNMTLEDMSKVIKIGIPTISDYEKGKKYPRAENIWRLKEAYQLSDEELLKWIEYINKEKGDK
ncbi:MAG: helix-turn-helix transcriptional regulator [Clostridia bacterium]|nr:helix-turn-helix transcriptional regulator [Clostridia bacterium]